MAIKVYVLGGIDEAGRNMTAYEFDDTIIICDIGIHLSNLVLYNNEVDGMNLEEMVEKDIVANPKLLLEKKEKVKAIVISHAHLDHLGGIQYMASLFNCPIFGSPFTIEVLKVLMKGRRNNNFPSLRNKFIPIPPNNYQYIGKGVKLEFINVTHSTPQCSGIAIHTPNDGIIYYGMDFKFDDDPLLGLKSNKKRLLELKKEGGGKGVSLAIIDSLRSNSERKNLTEKVVKEMLNEVIKENLDKNIKGIVISTFASHITRLKSIIEVGLDLNRKIVFLGRSIGKYALAAKNAGLIDFKSKGIIICETPQDVNRWLSQANKNKENFLLICTGHQGEENAVLSRIAEGRTPYKLNREDKVIFSSEVIPTQINIEQSQILQAKLESTNCHIYRDVHVSGHGTKMDIEEIIKILNPKHIIPGHGHIELKEGAFEVAKKLGYVKDKTLLVLADQKIIEIKTN